MKRIIDMENVNTNCSSEIIFETPLMAVRKSLVDNKYKYLVDGTTYDHTYAIVSTKEKAIRLAVAMQELLAKR